MINSRSKGKRAELAFAALLRESGFDARRGQQFAGGADSPDVVCDALAWLHIETKHVERLDLIEACAQAERDSAPAAPAGHKKPWIVAHRRNGTAWRITMSFETFLKFLRGKLPVAPAADAESNKQHQQDAVPPRGTAS